MSFGTRCVAPILPDFFRQYPDIAVDLHLSDEKIDLIGEGFDAALRIAVLKDSSLVAKRLATVRRFIVATPSYLARRSGLLAVKDDGEKVKRRCTGVNHGYSSNRAAWRIARRRRARSWRTLGYGHHAGNVPPNIGRPLFDDSRVASS